MVLRGFSRFARRVGIFFANLFGFNLYLLPLYLKVEMSPCVFSQNDFTHEEAEAEYQTALQKCEEYKRAADRNPYLFGDFIVACACLFFLLVISQFLPIYPALSLFLKAFISMLIGFFSLILIWAVLVWRMLSASKRYLVYFKRCRDLNQIFSLGHNTDHLISGRLRELELWFSDRMVNCDVNN